MPTTQHAHGIRYVEIGVTSLDRSLDFYTCLLGFQPIQDDSRPTRNGTQWLSADTALIKLTEIGKQGQISSGQDAPRGRGFKHIGWKVGDVRLKAEPLRAASVQFTIDPVDALGEVTVAFFKDPDGTLLEYVDRHVQYDTILAPSLAEQERLDAQARPADAGPVFDHVAAAVQDLDQSLAYYQGILGYEPMGQLDFGGPEGAVITYLSTGNSVLELFSFNAAETTTHPLVPREHLLGIRNIGITPNPERTVEELILAGTTRDSGSVGDNKLVIDRDDIALSLP